MIKKKIFLLIIENNIFISVFIFSQLYNIFMNIGYLPIMGICLPFLSYGGSSLVVFSIYIAIILRLKTNNI